MEGEYFNQQTMAVQDVPQMLKESFEKVTVDEINAIFKELFITN